MSRFRSAGRNGACSISFIEKTHPPDASVDVLQRGFLRMSVLPPGTKVRQRCKQGRWRTVDKHNRRTAAGLGVFKRTALDIHAYHDLCIRSDSGLRVIPS